MTGFTPLTSQELLAQAQTATGKRQKLLLSLMRLQLLSEDANMPVDHRETIREVIGELQNLIPAKAKPVSMKVSE